MTLSRLCKAWVPSGTVHVEPDVKERKADGGSGRKPQRSITELRDQAKRKMLAASVRPRQPRT